MAYLFNQRHQLLDLSPNDPESAVEETVFQTEEVEVSDEGFVDVHEETIGSLLDYNEIQSPSTSEEVFPVTQLRACRSCLHPIQRLIWGPL